MLKYSTIVKGNLAIPILQQKQGVIFNRCHCLCTNGSTFYTKNDNCTNKIHANWIFLSFFFLQSAVDQKDLTFAPELSF